MDWFTKRKEWAEVAVGFLLLGVGLFVALIFTTLLGMFGDYYPAIARVTYWAIVILLVAGIIAGIGYTIYGKIKKKGEERDVGLWDEVPTEPIRSIKPKFSFKFRFAHLWLLLGIGLIAYSAYQLWIAPRLQ